MLAQPGIDCELSLLRAPRPLVRERLGHAGTVAGLAAHGPTLQLTTHRRGRATERPRNCADTLHTPPPPHRPPPAPRPRPRVAARGARPRPAGGGEKGGRGGGPPPRQP